MPPSIGLLEKLFDHATGSTRRALLALALIAAALFTPGFATLQPMDRDEPRFAQASKQMIESGDLVDIRFQTEARHKKPVGIYWIQAAIVSGAETVMGPSARTTIWLYRLPSLAAAILAVLATFWTATAFLTRRTAFLSALLFAATILIGVEARLAKTDAFVTMTVVVAMGGFARVWLGWAGEKDGEGRAIPPPSFGLLALFWTAIAAGVLVKGPITPMVPLFAGLVLAVKDRAAGWASRLKPFYGLLWTLLLVAPWFVMILMKTKGAFLTESVGQDMLGKVASGQESHGAPPGLYFLVFWATAWPLAPFVALAAPFVWRARREAKVAFLLAWAVPLWLLFEAVPTKLPHYVLPAYPALAILAGLAIERGAMAASGWWTKIARGLILFIPAALAVAAVGAGIWFGTLGKWLGVQTVLLIVAMVAMGVAAWLAAGRGDFRGAALRGAASALAAYLLVLGQLLPGAFFEPFRLSPRLVAEARAAMFDARDCPDPAYATVLYREPSLVFLTRTGLVMTDGPGAAAFMASGPCRVAFVEAREEQAFLAGLGAAAAQVKLASRVAGINMNGGRKLDIGVYARH